MSKIKVEPFMIKQGNRVGKGAIDFEDDNILSGFHLLGFTICEDAEGKLFVLFPSSIINKEKGQKPYFFLKPNAPDALDKLSDKILDVYEEMTKSKV